jgi:Fe-S-cluster containining protein
MGRGKGKMRAAVDAHQARVIIPHCPDCTKPCCNLDELVLEMEWKSAQALYQIKTTRSQFDQKLHEGDGPSDLKESHGKYYAHTKPCRAYVDKKCTVYGTDKKPEGCTDFPLYVDGDAVTADKRCEAIDIELVQRDLEQSLGRKLKRTVDSQYDFFVTFEIMK